MKKKILAGLLASATLVGICVTGGVSASAAQVDSQDTDVKVGFTEHSGPHPGNLAVRWSPFEFDFNSNNAVNAANTSLNEVKNNKKYLVVSDERAFASTNEWKLTGELGTLKTTTSDELTGAVLKFDTALHGYTGTKAPEEPGSIVAFGARSAVVSGANISIAADSTASPTNIMEDNGGGIGAYTGDTALEMSNIKLEVPGGVAKSGSQYSTKLTWSLEDAI